MAEKVPIRGPEQGHRDFWGVMRLYEIDHRYKDQALPGLYEHHNNNKFGHTHHVGISSALVNESSAKLEEQRGLGVMVNQTWSAQGNSAYLAQYCGFRDTRELTAYVDMIIPDIVHEAAFIASDPVGVDNGILSGKEHLSLKPQEGTTGDIFTFQKFIKDNRFYDLGGPSWKGWIAQHDFTEKFVKPNPIDLVRSYQTQPEIREFVDYVVNYCPKPTFIPVRKWHFRKVRKQTFKHKTFELSPEAFVLSHAVQILLFAPQDFSPDRVYSRDSAKYEHRFPTPEFIGGGTRKVIAGMFSMEDLHRAILIFYYMVSRRKQDHWIGIVPEDDEVDFPGYHGPDAESTSTTASDAEIPDDDDQVQSVGSNPIVSQWSQYCVIL